MLDLKELPLADALGPCLLAGAAWFGVNYAVLAPELGDRLSKLEYVPHCAASVGALQTANKDKHEARRREIAAKRRAMIAKAEPANEFARQQAQGARAAAGMIMNGPLGNLMGAMAGSKDFQRDMMALTPKVPEVDLSVLNLPELPAPLPVSSSEDRKGYCACIASLTMARHRLAFTGYTSSLTAYEPEAVTGFSDAMAAMVQEGACGGLPGGGEVGE